MALLDGGGRDSTISYRLILMVYFPKDIISYPVFLPHILKLVMEEEIDRFTLHPKSI